MTHLCLVDHPLSPYAQKIRILLREKGIPFETRMPEGIGSNQDAASLRAINPRREVPVLEYGDVTLYDSAIILEFLEETHPEPALMPKAPIDRARARRIGDVCGTHWEAINWGILELRYFRRGGDAGPALMRRAGDDIGHMQHWLSQELGAAPWLGGEEFGWADMVALPFVDMSGLLGFAPKPASPLAAWLDRARQRPSVAATFAESHPTLSMLEGVAERLHQGDFQRQYRDHRLEWMIRAGGVHVVADGLEKNNIRFNDLEPFAASERLAGRA